jgi:alpha-galactosidase
MMTSRVLAALVVAQSHAKHLLLKRSAPGYGGRSRSRSRGHRPVAILGTALASVAAVATCVALLPGVSAARAQGTPALLAATPYMGWDTSYALPGGFTEAAILQQAAQLKSSGLEGDGYRLVWLDAGWWQGQRDSAGDIVVSATQWPHGIAWLAATLHSNGFKLGVYTDAGATGCTSPDGGSFGHYQQDINTLVAWGIDAVKVDWCGGSAQGLDPSSQYAQIHQAIANNSGHRPMLLEICNFLQPGQKSAGVPVFDQSAFFSYSFGSLTATSWRTDTDIGTRGNVPFSSVLRNMDADATEPGVAGPGHWNDPGYLSPDQDMSAAQFQTQFSMWAILAAPLMISQNMLTISKASLGAVANKAVIAVDQDPAGVQGTLVSDSGNGEVWIKPLIKHSYAVALLNRGATAIQISTTATALRLPAARSYTVTNLWTNQRSTSTATLTATVQPYATVLIRVTPN